MHTKVTALRIESTRTRLMLFGALMVLGLLIPSLGLPQPITGPLVNALLIVTVSLLGVWAAGSIGVVTPMVALAHGVLPLPMMVMIPFIAVGNLVLIVAYDRLRTMGFWPALGIGASLKFLWLTGTVTWFAVYVLGALSGGQAMLPPALVSMMTWPQLATAIAGGIIAYGIIYGVSRFAAKR